MLVSLKTSTQSITNDVLHAVRLCIVPLWLYLIIPRTLMWSIYPLNLGLFYLISTDCFSTCGVIMKLYVQNRTLCNRNKTLVHANRLYISWVALYDDHSRYKLFFVILIHLHKTDPALKSKHPNLQRDNTFGTYLVHASQTLAKCIDNYNYSCNQY